MAVDKLVDSTQLDADLTSVANAIRTKGGTSAQLAFPSDFVSAVNAISTGGDPLEMARKIANGTITSYVDDSLTAIRSRAFSDCSNMTEFICHNVTTGGNTAFYSTKVRKIALPRWTQYTGYAFGSNSGVYQLDLTDAYRIAINTFNGCSGLSVLVLRYSGVVSLQGINAFANTPFASGKAGGTLYIPKVLYDHLGDGSSSDYKAATNWSTILGYANNQVKSIESTHTDPDAPIDLTLYYVDGTPLPA